MLRNRPQGDAAADVAAWAGRDRAAKVTAAASTIAHGWDRLPAAEFSRLGDALDHHVRSYLEWLSGTAGDDVDHLRTLLGTILAANDVIRDDEGAAAPHESRSQAAATLLRAARELIAGIDALASRQGAG